MGSGKIGIVAQAVKDELIARLENRGVRAALDQALANVGVARVLSFSSTNFQSF